MALKQFALEAAYYGRELTKRLIGASNLRERNALRVLLYHDIAPEAQCKFAAQLRWLGRRWNFVSVERFAAMVEGSEPIRGRNLLLTFDDGFLSNRRVAEEVLNPLRVKALFFVIEKFASLTDVEEARRFVAAHIQPGRRFEEIPDRLVNMRWTDLEALLEHGHSVGGHTATHARLSVLETEEELRAEIVGSADLISERLGTPIDHFAYTFGDLRSFSPQALHIARRRFRFIYSGLRGNNAGGISQFALRRDAVEAEDSNGLMGAYTEGLVDPIYAGSRTSLDEWIKST